MEKQLFEEWYKNTFAVEVDFRVNSAGKYINFSVNLAWRAWEARAEIYRNEQPCTQ